MSLIIYFISRFISTLHDIRIKNSLFNFFLFFFFYKKLVWIRKKKKKIRKKYYDFIYGNRIVVDTYSK